MFRLRVTHSRLRHTSASRRVLALLASAVWIGGIGASFGRPLPSSDQQTLTLLSQVRDAHPVASSKPLPIHVHAVVTYYDSVAPNLFVQDDTAGIWVDLRGDKAAPPRVGQLLDLTGAVGAGFAPYVAKPHWRVLGSAPLPKPTPLSYEQASTGSFDSQWVEMEGIVRSFAIEAADSVLVIDVATPTGAFRVRLPSYHAPFPTQLVDAKVRFIGVCAAAFNRRNQLIAIHLMMPDLGNATIIQPALADPFSVPVTPVDQIGRFSAQLTDVHRVKVLGVVTARFPGRGLFLMDTTGGAYAETQDGSPVNAGDEAEVIGFPEKGIYSTVLRSASIRPTGQHVTLAPAKIDGRAALRGSYDAALVEITGTIQSINRLPGSYSLVLESDDHVGFGASFADASSAAPPPPVGSKVELTGICSVSTDESGDPRAFEIVLRNANDIKLLSLPPWLTGRRAVMILSALALLTAAIFGWVLILRKRVRSQTKVIKARLENEAALEERYRRIFERNLTGLYVATADGRVIDCNETCAHILGYPSREALLESHDEVESVTGQFHQHLHADAARAESHILNAEYRFKRRDGSWRWALINVRLVQHADSGTPFLEGGLVDITDRKAAEEQVQYLAYYDSLTGLPNRALLTDRLSNSLASARRHKEKVAILFLDLDRFKIINDSLGHSYGDLLLKEVAERLRQGAHDEDTVARVGGDEFLIVLHSVKESAEAAFAAERIVERFEKEFEIQGHSFKVSCSIGISIFPEHGGDGETLIKNADAAMYAAKESGRYTFRFFTDEMNAQVVERLTLENDLRLALERKEFFLVYQPQMSLATGKITGFEALLRWQHPEKGLVPPGRFIEVAESSGLIIPLGEWVLRTACAQAKTWQGAGLYAPSVAVNVSAVQFRQEGFCDLVKDVLRDTGLDPQCLELELTESLLLSTSDAMFSLLAALKQMGVNLAIDDFGTGYSSLSYLRQFLVSKLKIDGSFIKDVAVNSDDAAITSAIIDMGKALNLTVIAECVETEAQMEFLQARHCDEMQGYYFSRPLMADNMEKRMKVYKSTMEESESSLSRDLLLDEVDEYL